MAVDGVGFYVCVVDYDQCVQGRAHDEGLLQRQGIVERPEEFYFALFLRANVMQTSGYLVYGAVVAKSDGIEPVVFTDVDDGRREAFYSHSLHKDIIQSVLNLIDC